MGKDPKKIEAFSKKMKGRIGPNKGVKGRKPWHNISGLTGSNGKPPWNKGNKGVTVAWNKGVANERWKGAGNPNWNGGVTEDHEKIRKTMEYREWRRQVFKRDKFTCQECGRSKEVSGKLHADHIKPFAYFPELRHSVDNGRTLCEDCHKETETYGAKARTFKKSLALVIMVLLISFQSFAQTAMRFDNTGTAYGGTAQFTTWTATASATIAQANPTGFKTSTAIADKTATVDNTSATATTCFGQFISPALVAQTISGTVTGYARLSVSNATGCTAQSRVKITVINRAGFIQATLLAITAGAANLTTTLTSYQMLNAAALSSYSCADGDRICIEIGIGRSAGTTSRSGTISFGTSSSTDITAAGSTNANNPVITFSGNLSFYKGGTQ
jgi:hypothetical protein